MRSNQASRAEITAAGRLLSESAVKPRTKIDDA
jgi:hypothetical protein